VLNIPVKFGYQFATSYDNLLGEMKKTEKCEMKRKIWKKRYKIYGSKW
jgi:hypothetical protein